jgi:cytochrome c peroxidase
LASSCAKEIESTEIGKLKIMEVPKGFPEIEHPEGNEYTSERWELGKQLFYDPILSKDGSISCASCHDPSLAFSDNESVSIGSGGLVGTRNAPSLANVAYHPYYTREGGLPTLEMQILVPIQEHNEFNNNIVLIADTLAKIPAYVQMAKSAYDRELGAFVITRALSQFERSMISGQSQYDLEYNYGIEGSISEAAVRGKILFESERTSCGTCHSGFNFTNYSFQNNGLYDVYPDNGRERLTQDPNDRALFKVPSLRNVEVTGPYMHDGSIKTLTEVIEHYNNGGRNHSNKSSLIEPMGLKDSEKTDLLAFLESLTDQNFLTNKNLSNE